MKRRRGLIITTAALGALALTGCGGSAPEEAREQGGADTAAADSVSATDDAAQTGTAGDSDDAGEAVEAVEAVVTLEPGEEFLSVSPAGTYLLTATDGSAPEAPGAQWCIRSGTAYEAVTCMEELADHTALEWSPDEVHLAVVQQHSSRPEQYAPRQVQASITVLDPATGTIRDVMPEGPAEASGAALTWSPDGSLLHTWSADSDTELRSIDLTIDEPHAQTVQHLGDASVHQLEHTEVGLHVLGEFDDGFGIYDVGDGTGEATFVTRVLSDQLVRAVSGDGRWVVQGQDSHDVMPPIVHTVPAGERVELRGVPGKSVASDFSPTAELVTLTILTEGTIALTVLDHELQVADEVTFAHPEGDSYRYELTWTERGITVVSTFRDAPQQVTIYPH